MCVFTCLAGGHETSDLGLIHKNLFCLFLPDSRLGGLMLWFITDLLNYREWDMLHTELPTLFRRAVYQRLIGTITYPIKMSTAFELICSFSKNSSTL